MMLSLADAATATGLNRSTVLRSIKSGRLSATRNEVGEWRIDAAELHRVYPPAERPAARPGATREHAQGDAQAVELRARAELAEARLSDLQAMLSELRTDRDSWRSVAERLALAAPGRPWWRRLAG